MIRIEHLQESEMQDVVDADGVMRILEEAGALQEGHFQLRGGLHSDTFFDIALALVDTDNALAMCTALAEQFKNFGIQTVVGPYRSGALIAQLVAVQLAQLTGKHVFAVPADKAEKGGYRLREVFRPFISGKDVLIVDDVFTKGGSITSIMEAIASFGGHVWGTGAIVNRGLVSPINLGIVNFVALATPSGSFWDPAIERCPLCANNTLLDSTD
ncbi:MAG: phosphoribosyltransferase family protein [Candidatus Andersenbacteria bacterium]